MTTASPIDALLAPRTLRVVGKTGTAPLRYRRPCRLKKHGNPGTSSRVDVELRFGEARGSAEARAVLVAAGRAPRPAEEPQLVLGRGSALWTPSLQIGFVPTEWPGKLGDGQQPCLIVTQGAEVARHLVIQALARELPLLGAVATGSDRPTSWQQIVAAARTLDPAPVVLLALHRASSLERLLAATLGDEAAGNTAGNTAVLSLGEARWAQPPSEIPADGWFLPRLSVGALADAAGWAVVDSAEQLVEAGALLSHGVSPARLAARSLSTRATSADEAALLSAALDDAGLPPRVTVAAKKGARSRRNKVALVADGQGLSVAGASPSAVPLPTTHLEAALGALAALRRAGASVGPGERRGKRNSPRTAEGAIAAVARHLDYIPTQLGEHDLRQILVALGLPVATGVFVRSASAAATAAKRQLPAALRAVGSALWGDSRAVIDSDLPNTAAVREAFHRLLDRCREIEPPPVVDGMLVYPEPPPGDELGCSVIWLPGQTLMVLDGSDGAQRVLRCPAALEAVSRATRSLLPTGAADSAADHLWQLAHAAPALAERLAWVRIERLIISAEHGLTVDGCFGTQRFHLLGLTR